MHQRQITIDALDAAIGEVSRGQVQSTPAAVQRRGGGVPGPPLAHAVGHVGLIAARRRISALRQPTGGIDEQ